MKSIDKLREYVDEQQDEYNNHNVSFVWQLSTIADEIEAEIAERYMLLPCDYDGEPLHIGDITNEGKVARMIVRDDGESSVYVYKLPNVLHEFACYEVEHVKPRTLEDVLREYGKAYHAHMADNYMNYDGTDEQVVEKYADEIRELLGCDAE